MGPEYPGGAASSKLAQAVRVAKTEIAIAERFTDAPKELRMDERGKGADVRPNVRAKLPAEAGFVSPG